MPIQYDFEEETIEAQAPMKRDPLDPSHLLSGFAHYEPMITEMEAEVSALEINDEESDSKAKEMSGQARKLDNELDGLRKEKGKPFKAVLDAMMDVCKPFSSRLKTMVSDIEQKRRPYLIQKEALRKEAEEKARAEAERVRKEAEEKARKEMESKAAELKVPVEEVPPVPVVVAPVYIPPAKTDGLEDITIWEVADWKSLPDEFFADLNPKSHDENFKKNSVFPHVRIGKMVAAGILNIPGVVFTKTQKVKTRATR